jgi:23S rRNA (adenine2503-C2)-methyltransferase
VRRLRTDDGRTIKFLWRLFDGALVESVLMRYPGRITLCISSQAGCGMNCPFCATGQAGLTRNLSAAEIVDQVVAANRAIADGELGHSRGGGRERVHNIVFMGMGEPLANWRAVWRAVEQFTSADGMGLGARHVTVSTVGLVPGIRRLAEQSLQVGLAVSLHAPDEALRERLIPTAHRFPLPEIITACREYIAKTGRRITFEYCLMDGVNDAPEQARALGRLLGGMLCHVNLIPVNPTPDGAIGRPPRARTLAFQRELAAQGVPCTVRVEKGVEISAACGQLRGERAELPLIDAPLVR